jgi:hypothetical protein
MVGLERVLHAEQKAKPQNSEHAFPARPTVTSGGNFTLVGCKHNPYSESHRPG